MSEEDHIKYSETEWDQYTLPKNTEESYKYGLEYYDKYIKGPLPEMIKLIDTIKEDKSVSDDKVANLFLDRDSRPFMYAYNVATNSRYTSIPVAASSILFNHGISEMIDVFQTAELFYLHKVKDPSEWSRLIGQMFDDASYLKPMIDKLTVMYKNTYGKRLSDKKLLFDIDIGYRGSAVEISRYLLSKSFPDAEVIPLLFYKYSEDTPTRGIIKDETTWYAELTIPHSTTGYAINKETKKLRYLKEKIPLELGHGLSDQDLERKFYQGVIAAAEKEYPGKEK